MRYLADEKMEKDPQTPFIIVTKSAKRKFLDFKLLTMVLKRRSYLRTSRGRNGHLYPGIDAERLRLRHLWISLTLCVGS